MKRRRPLTIVDQHQLRVARATLKMPDAILGMLSGPTKIEARQIIRRLTGK